MSTTKNITTEEAKLIGKQLGVNWSKFDIDQFRMGMNFPMTYFILNIQCY